MPWSMYDMLPNYRFYESIIHAGIYRHYLTSHGAALCNRIQRINQHVTSRRIKPPPICWLVKALLRVFGKRWLLRWWCNIFISSSFNICGIRKVHRTYESKEIVKNINNHFVNTVAIIKSLSFLERTTTIP